MAIILQQSRLVLALLLISSIWLKALIPIGYMPASDKNGETHFIKCHGTSSQTPTPSNHGEKICPFAGVLFQGYVSVIQDLLLLVLWKLLWPLFQQEGYKSIWIKHTGQVQARDPPTKV
jgi:hypothetical protein